MHSKHAPQSAKNALQGSTKGVRKLPDRPLRPSPFGVAWTEFILDKREVRTQWFPTAEARDDRISELTKARREGGRVTMTRREVLEWQGFKAAIGETPWTDVVLCWKAYNQQHGLISSTVTVAEHVQVYLAELNERLERSEVAHNTVSHHKSKLAMFAEDFPNRRVSSITDLEIKAWLASKNLKAQGTYNNYRKIIGMFFTHAVDSKIIRDNPVKSVKPRRGGAQKEVGINTVPELALLLWTAMTFTDGKGNRPYQICLYRLALEIFAGVRFSSANRLTHANVSQKEMGIRHPGTSIKTLKHIYVQGYPPVLWEWLKIAPDDSKLTPRQYLELKSKLFFAARVKHPHNTLRHSFCTYHVAANRSAAQTAILLCHRNEVKLWSNYKGNASIEDGELFMTMTPERVKELAQPALDLLDHRDAVLAEVVPMRLPA